MPPSWQRLWSNIELGLLFRSITGAPTCKLTQHPSGLNSNGNSLSRRQDNHTSQRAAFPCIGFCRSKLGIELPESNSASVGSRDGHGNWEVLKRLHYPLEVI